MEAAADVRIDKWLWAVRLYKSRPLATTACRAGHVKMKGENVKPSHAVKVGQSFAERIGQVNRTVKVLGLLEKRVGAKLVEQCLDDLTPPPEHLRAAQDRPQPQAPRRLKGAGLPT